MPGIITTERLTLRPARASDLEAMHVILSSAHAMAFWSTLPHEKIDETRLWLEGMMATRADDFIVETKAGQVIGKVGFWADPEIGYILHPDAQGKGYAHEAVSAVIARAFKDRGLNEATADVDPNNTSSRRLLERLGFVVVGSAKKTYLLGHTWADSLYLRCTPETFTGAKTAWTWRDVQMA
ncbi:MAG: GNAT family N-acetyltransferase [Phenylobacterium sp.]|uniref:GNAT family N-acetyltransferase n=1 Tax=Phenylobacterium sp. TaxID=1871053 RepID=UPI0027314A05|nr:GNAT family N-acetyltransferase [Phenylobacterium sp.]MDP1616444.1 GNAT family N-acetyltransferase [Phenylobacterium sp.]MDP2008540.1 GNAT family N-acetyltransferase [Phenylobacterium sp.]